MWSLVEATGTNTKLGRLCQAGRAGALASPSGVMGWGSAQVSLWCRTGPAALLAVGSQGAWGGTVPHPGLWAQGLLRAHLVFHLEVGTVVTRWRWCGWWR